ncbi:MAG: hypothetical protein PHS86_13785 [Syntrophaceae bacterium]|nr:hypothetical protein [Syntrophaceae bacterium]
MNDNSLLEHLEELASRLGVTLREENLSASGHHSGGGYCKVHGQNIIFINKRDSRQRKIRILARSLNKFNLEGVFVPPAVRRIIETSKN